MYHRLYSFSEAYGKGEGTGHPVLRIQQSIAVWARDERHTFDLPGKIRLALFKSLRGQGSAGLWMGCEEKLRGGAQRSVASRVDGVLSPLATLKEKTSGGQLSQDCF